MVGYSSPWASKKLQHPPPELAVEAPAESPECPVEQQAGPQSSSRQRHLPNPQRALRREGRVTAKRGVRAERARAERFWGKSLRNCFASLCCSATGTGTPEFCSLLLPRENMRQLIL